MQRLNSVRKIAKNKIGYLSFATLVAFFSLTGAFGIKSLSSNVSAEQQCVVDTDNIIGWWKGEDNLNAEIGPNLTGTMGYEDANVGRGMAFNGYGSADSTWPVSTNDLPVVTTGVTAETWFKPVYDGQTHFLISRWKQIGTNPSDPFANSYALYISGGYVVWSTDETSLRFYIDLSAVAPHVYDGNYHHLAGTWSPTTINLYLDGQLVATQASPGGVLNPGTNTQFRLGSISGTGVPFAYEGVIDEATVFNRALTAGEIAAIYNAGSEGKCKEVDTAAPTISINSPANGATYLLGETVLADYSCADEVDGSGLATCAGTVPSGSAIDTSTVGPKTFTVNATDNAGNPATQTVNYSVGYQKTGFFSPVDMDAVNNVKAGSTVPVKWRLTDANGNPISNPGSFLAVTSGSTSCNLGDEATDLEEYAGNSGLQYLGDGNWQFNWKTPKTYAGQCRVMYVVFADGTSLSASFQFK